MDERPNVLIVEDETIDREGLRILLNRQGFAAEGAGTAEDALRLLPTRRWDLILTDFQMPGMDGLELLAEIKQRTPNTPVVMVSGHGSMDTVVRALRGGVNDFVPKPYAPDELLVIVRREIKRYRQSLPPGGEHGIGYQLGVTQLEEAERILATLRADSGARVALLVESNGSVIVAKGMIDELNLSALAALLAGSFAATAGVASLLGEQHAFQINYHEGESYGAYYAQVTAEVLLLLVFGREVKTGVVLFYTKEALPRLQQLFVRTGAPTSPARPVEPAVGRSEPTPGSTAMEIEPTPVFSLDSLKESGVLGDDFLDQLDAQLADLWGG